MSLFQAYSQTFEKRSWFVILSMVPVLLCGVALSLYLGLEAVKTGRVVGVVASGLSLVERVRCV